MKMTLFHIKILMTFPAICVLEPATGSVQLLLGYFQHLNLITHKREVTKIFGMKQNISSSDSKDSKLIMC